MIQVCPELEERLDKVWYKLQQYYGPNGPINSVGQVSQIELDQYCVKTLEKLVDGFIIGIF